MTTQLIHALTPRALTCGHYVDIIRTPAMISTNSALISAVTWCATCLWLLETCYVYGPLAHVVPTDLQCTYHLICCMPRVIWCKMHIRSSDAHRSYHKLVFTTKQQIDESLEEFVLDLRRIIYVKKFFLIQLKINIGAH